MTQETNVQNKIRLDLGKQVPALTLWRNAVSSVWAGRVVSHLPQLRRVVLEAASRFTAGLCVDSSDLIGRFTVTITPAMVGKKVAVFTVIEVKKDKHEKPTPGQLNFIHETVKAGGIGGVAYDSATALAIIHSWLREMTNGHEN
jgi:hypothetical protein